MRSCRLPNSLAIEVRGVSHGRSCSHSSAGLINDASVTGGNVVNFKNVGSNRSASATRGESLVICIVLVLLLCVVLLAADLTGTSGDECSFFPGSRGAAYDDDDESL